MKRIKKLIGRDKYGILRGGLGLGLLLALSAFLLLQGVAFYGAAFEV